MSAGEEGRFTGGGRVWRSVFRSVFRVDWSQIELGGAIRCTIGVLVPLVVGLASGAVADGVAAAVGALCAGFASFQGAYRSRASLTVLVAAGMAVSTMVGAVAARNVVAAVLVTALWGGLAGMMVSLGQGGLITGLQWVVAELIVGTIPMTLAQAAVRAAMVLAGGIIQTVLVVALWPVRTYRLERRAVEAAYLDLGSLAASITSGDTLSPGAITLNEARQVLEDPQPFSRTGQLLAFQALVDEAERIRIELTALARHRSRLWDGPARGAVDKLLADAALTLRAIAIAVDRDEPPQLAQALAADLVGDSQAVEQALPVSDVSEWVRSEVATVTTALAGQLRSAVQIAGRRAGVRDQVGPGGRELPPRRSSPIQMPLETLSANLSWRSAAFRHAVRLAAALAVATIVYRAAAIPHGYWVPLTVLVVLRQDFTSTAVRGISRILGTIAGAALATLLAAVLRPDSTGLTVLFTFSVFASYLLVRANYTLFSIAVTSYVVFLLAFVKLPELSAVTYRLTSTLVGGAFAVVAYLLWPTWESSLVGPQLADLLEAQADYSGAVLGVFVDPAGADRRRLGELRSVARRARSNAEASLDRMASEPPRATRSVPINSRQATSVLAAARRFALAVLTLHSDLPPADFVPALEVTPLSHGIGGATRGNAARLRTLVPLSGPHPVAGVRSASSWGQQLLAQRFGWERSRPAAGSDRAASVAAGDGSREEATWRAELGPGTPVVPGSDRHPRTLRGLHSEMAKQLQDRMASSGREADLIGLLVAESDLMVDSVNTVSEVLGRASAPLGEESPR
jgi:uncharacterized membrane protein YccC